MLDLERELKELEEKKRNGTFRPAIQTSAALREGNTKAGA